jgi:hypothetical protein
MPPIVIGAAATTPQLPSPIMSMSLMAFQTVARLTPFVPGQPIDPQVLRDAGYLLVDDFGADPTGQNDSITAINNCITQARSDQKSIWFTEAGDYRVSSSVRCFKWDKNVGSGFSPTNTPQIYGGGSGATRPKITLIDGSSGFQNANDARPVVVWRMFQLSGEGVEPADVLDDTGIFVSQSNNLFYATWQNIDIDCGNNPGAFGMYMPTAQRSFACDVTIDCSQAAGGWWGLLGRNGPIMNVTIIGGVEQLVGDIQIAADGNAGIMLCGVTLIPDSRTVTPFKFDDFSTCTIVGFNFLSNGFNGHWIQIQGTGGTGYGNLSLIDGIVDGGNRVIDNSAGKNFYARNVYATNVTGLVQSGSQPAINGSGTWRRIVEYSYTDQTPVNISSGDYINQSIVDGVKSTTPEAIANIENSVAAPTRDYIDDHTIFVHRIDSGDYEDITAPQHAGGAVSGPELFAGKAYDDSTNWDISTPDSLAACQSAILAAKIAGHNRVLVPRGFFYNSATLDLEPDTKLFGVSSQYSKIGAKQSWQPTSKVHILRTADDPDGTCQVAELACSARSLDPGLSNDPTNIPPDFDWFSWIHWRTGRFSSSIWRVNSKQFPVAAQNATQPHDYHYFTGNGGGRHYSLTDQSGRGYTVPESIGLRIEGTSQPMQLYGFNPEMGKGGSQATQSVGTASRITDASNIRIYSTKREGSASTMLLTNVTNFAHYGSGREYAGSSNTDGISASHHVKGDSDDFLFSCIVHDGSNVTGDPDQYHSYENINGQAAVGINYPNGVSLHKRGELDDDVMHLESGPPPTNTAPVASNVTVTATPIPPAVLVALGQTLTGSYTYSDAEFDPESGSTFRWLRNGSPIAGETSQTYLITIADEGQTLNFEVTPRAGTGTTTGTPVQSNNVAIAYPPFITDITFDMGSVVNVAPGNGASASETDNWPATWGVDNNQHTSFGDGFGFGNLAGDLLTRASIGWSKISGDLNNFSCQDMHKSGKSMPGFNGKCQGMLGANGKLYSWWDAKDTTGNTGGSREFAYDSSTLVKSENFLASGGWDADLIRWDSGDWGAGDLDGWFGPSFVQYGMDHGGTRSALTSDLYAYSIINEHDNDNYQVQTPGGISLMRCLVANLESGNKNHWEYLSGIDGNNFPSWSTNLANRIPTFQDTSDGNHISTMSFNEPLRRYILTTFHNVREVPGAIIGFYDAPEPWGPWHTIEKEDVEIVGPNLATGGAVIMWNFSNKWLSPDGLDFAMIGTLTGQDQFGVVEGSFSVFEEPPPPPPVGFPNEIFTTVSVNPGPASLVLPADHRAMLVIGMSNTHHYTNTLMPLANPTSKTFIINGAQGGAAAAQWAISGNSAWSTAAGFVSSAGYSANEVSVVFIGIVDRLLGDTYEDYIARLEANLRSVVLNVRSKYPNAIMVMNGLHNEFWATSHPEPHAWASSLIADTIINDPANPDVYWGPYIWNPEPNGRSGDGFNITEADHQPNGNVHLEEWGNVKIANSIMDWFDVDSIGQSIFK